MKSKEEKKLIARITEETLKKIPPDESPIKEDGEDFDNYIVLARDEFVKEVNKQDWNTKLRMTAENLLIAYDQMRQRLIKTPNQ